MRKRKKFIAERVRVAGALLTQGNRDPSAAEIARALCPGMKAPNGQVESVIGDLPDIRKALEGEPYNFTIILVNGRYYEQYREEAPTTKAEARRCLPACSGTRGVGLRLATGTDDPLVLAAFEHQQRCGAGKVRKNTERFLNGLEGGHFSLPAVRARLLAARSLMQPSDPQLMERVMGELPGRAHSSAG